MNDEMIPDPDRNILPKYFIRILLVIISFGLTLVLCAPLFSSRTSSSSRYSRPGQYGEGVPSDPIFGLNESFVFGEIPPLERVESVEKFLENCIFSVTLPPGTPRNHVFLRVGSAETFSKRQFFTQRSYTDDTGSDNFNFVNNNPTANQKTGEIFFLKAFEPKVPHIPRLQMIDPGQEFHLSADGSVRVPYSFLQGDRIPFQFETIPTLNQFSKVRKLSAPDPLLDVSMVDSPELRAIAELAVNGEIEPERKVLAITAFLEKNHKYFRSPRGNLATSSFPVSDFLTGRQAANCQYFAGAACVLMRMNDIPCRTGIGFWSSYVSEDGRTFYVNSAGGHAWPEVLTDKGWTICEIHPKLLEENAENWQSWKLPSGERSREILRISDRERPPMAQDSERRENSFWKNLKKKLSVKKIENGKVKTLPPEEEEDGNSNLAWLKGLVRFSVFCVSAVILWQIFEKFLLPILSALLKRLFKKRKEKSNDGVREAVQDFHYSLLDKMKATNVKLAVKDVISSFNRFSKVMGEIAQLDRKPWETPKEYIIRVCTFFQLDPDAFSLIPEVFSLSLYGHKTVEGEMANKYISTLEGILQVVSKWRQE